MSADLLLAIKAMGLDLSKNDDVRRFGAMVADLLHDGTISQFFYGMASVEINYGDPAVARIMNKAADDVARVDSQSEEDES